LHSARASPTLRFTLPSTMGLDATTELQAYEVRCSLDGGRTVVEGKKWDFTLLNSRTEMSIIRPSTGPVGGGTIVSIYGVMFPNIPSQHYVVRWDISVNTPYSRVFSLFSTATRL